MPTSADPVPVLMLARELSGLGGIERDVSKLSRHLAPHGIAPHVASFIAGGERWDEIAAAGIPMLHLPVTSFKSWSAVRGARVLRRYVREHEIQVLHAFDSPTVIYGVPLGLALRVPVVLASQLWLRSMLSPVTQRVLSIADGLAHGIFVNCKAAARELAEDWNVPPSRIHVCYNGLETSEFHPRNRKRLERLPGASVVVGTVAALRKEKALPDLLLAFAELHARDPNALLLIVGSGVMKPALVQLADQLGLTNRCVFEEAVRNPADWYRAIDIFVLPSTTESFSNALLEAMGCGCCPVGSHVGGTPELIAHGERGLLFESGNTQQLAESLIYLATHEAERCEMARRASDFASEHLSIQTAAARLAAIYRHLLMQRGFMKGIPPDGENECAA